jgi:hypothetical protein
MALSASDLRLGNILLAFQAIWLNANFAFKKRKGPDYLGVEDKVRARVCAQNIRDWAGETQIRRPFLRWFSRLEQATFLPLTAAIVVTIKMGAFFACWGAHARDYSTHKAFSCLFCRKRPIAGFGF